MARTARVQYISGEVSVAPSATNEWTAARVGQPLPSAEHVWTAPNARVEINLGGAFLRMNSEASVTLLAVTNGSVQVGVNQGEVSLSVGRLFRGEIYEIDTPNATLTVTKSGVYRVEVRPNENRTLVTTRKGAIVATGTGAAVTVDSGKQVVFLNGTTLQHTAEKAPTPDGFEDWASVRDKALRVSPPPFGVMAGYGPWPYGGVVIGPPLP